MLSLEPNFIADNLEVSSSHGEDGLYLNFVSSHSVGHTQRCRPTRLRELIQRKKRLSPHFPKKVCKQVLGRWFVVSSSMPKSSAPEDVASVHLASAEAERPEPWPGHTTR